MINHMQAAIEHAVKRQAEREAEGRNTIGGHAAGWVETPHGTLQVTFVHAEGRATIRAHQMRKTWTLDGKRIAAAKLEGMTE